MGHYCKICSWLTIIDFQGIDDYLFNATSRNHIMELVEKKLLPQGAHIIPTGNQPFSLRTDCQGYSNDRNKARKLLGLELTNEADRLNEVNIMKEKFNSSVLQLDLKKDKQNVA